MTFLGNDFMKRYYTNLLAKSQDNIWITRQHISNSHISASNYFNFQHANEFHHAFLWGKSHY